MALTRQLEKPILQLMVSAPLTDGFCVKGILSFTLMEGGYQLVLLVCVGCNCNRLTETFHKKVNFFQSFRFKIKYPVHIAPFDSALIYVNTDLHK